MQCALNGGRAVGRRRRHLELGKVRHPDAGRPLARSRPRESVVPPVPLRELSTAPIDPQLIELNSRQLDRRGPDLAGALRSCPVRGSILGPVVRFAAPLIGIVAGALVGRVARGLHAMSPLEDHLDPAARSLSLYRDAGRYREGSAEDMDARLREGSLESIRPYLDPILGANRAARLDFQRLLRLGLGTCRWRGKGLVGALVCAKKSGGQRMIRSGLPRPQPLPQDGASHPHWGPGHKSGARSDRCLARSGKHRVRSTHTRPRTT